MDLISIIVPIYNVEKYLRRCVDSILTQTYKNFELILVNDGSTDQCGTICNEYEQLDSRIRVIHKLNGGLSDARNAGLRVAQGEYIAFVDSDDWIAPNYLSCLLDALKSCGSDICECEILRTSEQFNEVTAVQDVALNVYETEKALELLIKDNVLHQYVWNKLYTRKCLDGIMFEVGKINEDEFWTYQVFGRAKRVAKINSVLYFYFQRPGSIMGTGYNLKRLDSLEAKQQRQVYIDRLYPSLSNVAKSNLIASCIYSGQMTLKFLKDSEKKRAREIISRVVKESRANKETIKSLSGSEKLWINMVRLSFWGTCRVKNLLRKGF